MSKRISWIGSALAAGLLVAACSSAGPSYYLVSNSSSVLLIEWAAPQNGQAPGTITYDSATGTAPGETLDVQTVPVKVTFNGSQVTFTLTGLAQFLGGGSLTGSFTGSGLQVTMPPDSTTGRIQSGTLASSTTTGYNAAVHGLQKSLDEQNTVAAAQQQQQREQQQILSDQQQVSSDMSALQSASGGLSGDVSALGSDTQTANTDLGTVKSDAAGGRGSYCDNVDTVASDADTVSSDASTLSSDLDTLTADIGTVQADISQLDSDAATLSDSGGSTPGDPQTAISQARAAIKAAVNSANDSIATVNADVAQAYQAGNGLASGQCSGAGPGSPPSPIQPLNDPGAPSTSPAGAGTGQWAIVAAYYSDIQSGDYKRAWALINSGKTTGQTYRQFVHGYSCTGAQQVTELSQSGAAVTFSLSATDSCTGQQQQFTGTDTVRGGKIVAATIRQTG